MADNAIKQFTGKAYSAVTGGFVGTAVGAAATYLPVIAAGLFAAVGFNISPEAIQALAPTPQVVAGGALIGMTFGVAGGLSS